jgi:hypothetical protein
MRAFADGCSAITGVEAVADVTRDVVQAIRFARTMSDDVTAVKSLQCRPPRTIRRASRLTRRKLMKCAHGRMWLGSPA